MTITDEMVERALNATTEELPEGVQYALIRGLNAMGWEIAITGSHDVMHAALTAALEGREEPDATAAYMAGFERGKEAAGTERYRHLKRGTTYRLVGQARVQTDAPLADMDEVTVYRCEQTGDLWARRRSEFEDGRFERVGGVNDPR